jgi:hypothetical protein
MFWDGGIHEGHPVGMSRCERRSVTRTGIEAATRNDAIEVLKQAWRAEHGDEPPSALAGVNGPYDPTRWAARRID